ncbi:MAG: heme exporter protein CcmD [Enterobacteriaceae bacterium]
MTPAFASWHDFFTMGGYALYVWLAAGLALSGFLLLLIHTHWQRRQILRQIRQRLRRQQRLQQNSAKERQP